MNDNTHGYCPSINTESFSIIKPIIQNILKIDNTSEFNYLSLSMRNHKKNIATSFPSNPEVIKDYLRHSLIEIDPVSSFERHTDKKILTFQEVSKYKNHGKCGLSYMEKRKKSGLLHGFHYIHRHLDWSFTIVFGSDFYGNGLITDEDLIERNQVWINRKIKECLFIIKDCKNEFLNIKKSSKEYSQTIADKKYILN